MKSKILSKALSFIIPHFVENFDKELFNNLDKNQKIVQSDLSLKSNSLLFVGLPFLIDSGSIKEFSISKDQNGSVLINISNAEISCTITKKSESNNNSSTKSLKNKIFKKCLANINLCFVFTNITFHINSVFDFHIQTLNFDSISKSTTINEKTENFISLIFTTTNLSFKIKNKSVFDSSFTLTINLPFGSNLDKQIIFKINESNINFTYENLPLFVSFTKSIFNCASTSQTSEFITLSILDEDNTNSSAQLSEIEEDNSPEISFGDMTKWNFNFELNSISIQVEDESKILISSANFLNDSFTISKVSLTNLLSDENDQNSIQYFLSFINIKFDVKEKNFTIQKIEEENNNNKFISFKQINEKNIFLTSKKNDNENKLDFCIEKIEFNGLFYYLSNWLLIQSRTIDLFYYILNELSSNDSSEFDTNSSSQFTENTELYDYSNESSAEFNQSLLTGNNTKIISPTLLSEFIKKFTSNAYSIGVTFPLIQLNFRSGFSSQLGVHLFFSLKKKSYQIIGSDCKVAFKKFEPILTKLSFQVSIQKNMINLLLSPSDLRLTEDECLLAFYNIVSRLKKLFDSIQMIDSKRKSLKKKNLSAILTKRLKMTIVTFNLILCKNVLVHSNENCEQLLRKNAFLMLSSSDIYLSASFVKSKLSVNFKSSPSLRFWNPKTSFWDYLVNPFHLNVSILYKNGIIHYDAVIPSSLEVNVTPLLVDCLIPKKCGQNDARCNVIDLGKFSPTNLALSSLRSRTEEILKKYENEPINSDDSNDDDGECVGSEAVSIYNGFGYPIPIKIVNDAKPAKTSSVPAFIKLNEKKGGGNDDGGCQLSTATVTAEEHRKLNQLKKDFNSSLNLKSELNSGGTSIKQGQASSSAGEKDDVIVLENEETKLIPTATVDSVICFPSFNEAVKISHLKCGYIIHNEMVIVPAFKKFADASYGKLIKLLPRFEIQNKTRLPLKILLLENNNEPDMNSKLNGLTIQPNGRISLNEIQCRKKIVLSEEKTDFSSVASLVSQYNCSNLTDKRSNYSLIKMYANSGNSKKYMKKENDVNHSNDRKFRESVLMSENFFYTSTIPNIYEFNSHNSVVKESFAFKLTNPISPLNKVLEVRPLFAVKNDLPFEVICTFVSELKNDVKTVSVKPEEEVDLNNFNSSLVGIQFTACVAPLGISRTIQTEFRESSLFGSNSASKVTPYTQTLQREIIEFPSKPGSEGRRLRFHMTFNYSEMTGQFVFYLFSPVVIVNKTEIVPLFVNDGQNIFEFSQSNFPPNREIEDEGNETFPTFIINSPALSNNGESASISISANEEGPFVLLPQMSQFLNVFAGKDAIYPFYIEYRKMNEFVSYYEIRPRLSIINKMPFELSFRMKEKPANNKNKSSSFCYSFVVGSNEEKTVTKCRNDVSFSVSPTGFPSIDEFVMQTPMSTVFRLTNEDDEEKVIHFQLDKNKEFQTGYLYNSKLKWPHVSQSFYLATFEPASIWMPCPTMFVIVNNIPNVPIHAQQCEESKPIRIAPNSTSLFPFDSPFSTPVVMITIAGKSQLVPLRNEIKATLFPFKLGSEKIYADLIVLSSGDDRKRSINKKVQALIIGYQPYYFSTNPGSSTSSSFVFNPFIKTYNFSFNFIVKELSISFFNDQLEEFILVCLKLIRTEMTSNQINFSIDSIQIDDQISFVKDTVVFKSKSSTTNSSLQKAMKEMKLNMQMNESNSLLKSSSQPSIHSNSGVDDEDLNDDVQSNFDSNSKLDWSLNLSNKSFFQLSIMFDFSLLNAQSLTVLVQPFDIVIDPSFVKDFLVYFANLFDGRKFILDDTLVYLQDFCMYPMNCHVLCKDVQKRKVHFSAENEGNDFHCKFNKLSMISVSNDFDHKITIGQNLASVLRNLLLFPFKSEKKCSVAFNSLVCHDLNMRLSAFLDILSRHLGFFAKNALSYLSGQIYTEKPEVSFSLFQASFVTSEYYNISNISINNSTTKSSTPNGANNKSNININIDDDKGNVDVNSKLNKEFASNFGVSSYLDSVIRIANLHPAGVFPVYSCSSNMIIEYKTIYLIVQDTQTLLSSPRPSSSSSSNRFESNVDSNSNLDLFSLNSSLSNYHFLLGNRLFPQKLFVMNKVQFLTAEMLGIETLIKKSLSNQDDREKMEKIHFLDYCGSMNTIIAVTDNFFFVYSLPSFILVSRFLLEGIVDVKVNKNRMIIRLKKVNKWKSNDPVILVDLMDDDVAVQLKFIIQTLLAQQNKFV